MNEFSFTKDEIVIDTTVNDSYPPAFCEFIMTDGFQLAWVIPLVFTNGSPAYNLRGPKELKN